MPGITIDEVKDWIKTDEGKELFSSLLPSYIQENGYKSPEEVEGLVRKNKELLGKVAKVNRPNTTSEHQQILQLLAESDLDDIEELEKVIQKTSKQSKEENEFDLKYRRLNKKYEEMAKTASEFEDKFKREKQGRIKTVKEHAITKALKNSGVKSEAFDMAFDFFDKRSEVEEDEDGNVLIIGKDSDGLRPTIDKFIESWSKTEKAKGFIVKPENKGAGLTGSGSDPKSKTMKRSEWDKASSEAQEAFYRSGGTVID